MTVWKGRWWLSGVQPTHRYFAAPQKPEKTFFWGEQPKGQPIFRPPGQPHPAIFLLKLHQTGF
ncbi:hypothetical protein ADN00_01445 [Ornatilinea apprima]|uniref:Uncharacterized protein n=1 Tax=Ornatilinea apprima TaxID=1134406 RepID=A0A0N8GPC8_9CHLR|nr:hypothetical protein ADN00_01445 [Ornatilinea apprima]